jgi:hypothetical protein
MARSRTARPDRRPPLDPARPVSPASTAAPSPVDPHLSFRGADGTLLAHLEPGDGLRTIDVATGAATRTTET